MWIFEYISVRCVFECQTFDGEKYNVESDLARCILHCKVHDVEEEKKSALVLTVDSNVFEKIQQDCSPRLLPELTFDELRSLLYKLFRPRHNFRTNRLVFHRTVQQQIQSLKEYIEHTKKLANSCNFGSYLNEALNDQIIFGINDNSLRERLLSIEDLDLDKAISISVQHESIEKDGYILSSKVKDFWVNQTEVNEIARKG